jgi:GntR family transcriptional repressor for pyruvate dehydrogenase complex
MEIEQVKSSSAPERVVKQFLKNLETGEMQPGQKLPTQEQLAAMFGVSRSSIREAMNALAMMGYLEIIQGRGSFIRKDLPSDNLPRSLLTDFFEKANLFHLMEIREVLECYAAEKAAVIANEENLAFLRKSVNIFEDSRNDFQAYVAADLDFHIALANAANLPEIGDLVKAIHKIVNRKLPVIFATSKQEKIVKSIDTAKQIAAYVMSSEGKQAARCMRNHLNTLRENLKDELLAEVLT